MTDDQGNAWRIEFARGVGLAVAERRKALGITASELSRRTEEIGYPVTRVAVAKIEGNHRGGRLDVTELIALAAALDTPPVMLLFPFGVDAPCTPLPGVEVSPWDATRWFTGEGPRPDENDDESPVTVLTDLRERESRRQRIDSLFSTMDSLPDGPLRDALFTEWSKHVAELTEFDKRIGYIG